RARPGRALGDRDGARRGRADGPGDPVRGGRGAARGRDRRRGRARGGGGGERARADDRGRRGRGGRGAGRRAQGGGRRAAAAREKLLGLADRLERRGVLPEAEREYLAFFRHAPGELARLVADFAAPEIAAAAARAIGRLGSKGVPIAERGELRSALASAA